MSATWSESNDSSMQFYDAEPYQSMATKPLDSLPVELLCEIAGECEPNDAMALTQTCRLMHATCYSASVFRSILVTAQARWQHQTLDIDYLSSYLRDDPYLWARCAVADARALSIRQNLDDCFQHDWTNLAGESFGELGVFDRFLRDSTILIFAKHPIMYHLGFTMLAVFNLSYMLREDRSDAIQKDFEDAGVLSLTNCAALLSIAPQHRNFENAARKNMLMAHSTLLGSRSHLIQCQDAAVFQLSNFAYLVRSSQKLDIRCHNGKAVPNLSPPMLEAIPMPKLSPVYSTGHDKGRIPNPFDHDRIYALTIRELIKPEYFQDGEWAGYFSNTARYRADVPVGFNFDSPMDNIHFTANFSAPNSQPLWPPYQQPYISLEGRGEDHHGVFTLKGFVTEEGIGDMVKQYVGRHGWRWWLSVTPFGIYGLWYTNTQSNVPAEPQNVRLFSGSFWIWKKAWSK